MSKLCKIKMVCLLTIMCGAANVQATTWINMLGGDWNDAANWDLGVPDGSDANLNSTAAAYQVTVGASPTGVVGTLLISNYGANTTRLDIAASGFAVSNGYINIGRNAEVRVANGGELIYTGNTSPVIERVATIENGGLLWVDGGTVAFTNLLKLPTASRAFVGSSSTGLVKVTAGTFAMNGSLEAKNAAAQFYLGNATGGYGHLKVSGTGRAELAGGYGTTVYIGNSDGYGHIEVSDSGRVELGNPSQSLPFVVGNIRGTGVIDLKDQAELEVLGTNQMAYIANVAGSTGRVSVAGNSKFMMQVTPQKNSFYLANDLGSLAEITVSDHGLMDIYGGGLFNMGGPDTRGRSVLTVKDQGYFEAGGGLSMCTVKDGTEGYAEINLEGGTLSITNGVNQGLTVGRVNAGGTGFSTACVNMSGGYLNLTKDYVSHNWGARDGILVGMVVKGATGGAQGDFSFSGGAITNFGALTLGLGLGATGTVSQTGGTFVQGRAKVNDFRNVVIGWAGCGSYCISGGTMLVYDEVYVGGVTTNQVPLINQHGQYFSMENTSKGLLQVDSGSFTLINNKTLFCGSNGEGTIVIGSNGVCEAKNIVLTNNLQSVVRFELGAQGSGILRATDTLKVYPGTKLEVDVRGYTGAETNIKLIDHGSRIGDFAHEDIVVTGNGNVVQTSDGVWLHIAKGTMLIVY